MAFRNYLCGTIFVVLLILGPVDHAWPAWLAIRIGYLIGIPLIVWLLFGWVWNYWQLNNRVEITLERLLSAMICIALFAWALLEATSKTHTGNSKWIQTRDGRDAVGDDIILPGPDWGNVYIIVLIALLILWFGVLKKGNKASDR